MTGPDPPDPALAWLSARGRPDTPRNRRLAASLLAFRESGGAPPQAPTPDEVAARLARVRACPDRGGVLPVSLQPECGCAELSECRAGRGSHPGRVTLADCLACVAGPQPPAPVPVPVPET